MPIVSSEIVTNILAQQGAGAVRMVRERHVDASGASHDLTYMTSDLGADLQTLLAEHAVSLGEQLDAPAPVDPNVPSAVDVGMRDAKFALKSWAIAWIKANPGADEADLYAAMEADLGAPAAGLARYLLAVYATGAAEQGYAPDASWPSFRAFIVSTPTEALEAI